MKIDFDDDKIFVILLKYFVDFLKILFVNFINISHFLVFFNFVFCSFQNDFDNLSMSKTLTKELLYNYIKSSLFTKRKTKNKK